MPGSDALVRFLSTDMEHPGRELVADTLTSLGFSEEMQNAPVSSLSGGWKMKLALGRAMLMKADIMLLDEPTNHLDVNNVAWLENYLTHLPQVTSIVVSHDSGFLDNVCTDIIHYEGRKLRLYRVSGPADPLSILRQSKCNRGPVHFVLQRIKSQLAAALFW